MSLKMKVATARDKEKASEIMQALPRPVFLDKNALGPGSHKLKEWGGPSWQTLRKMVETNDPCKGRVFILLETAYKNMHAEQRAKVEVLRPVASTAPEALPSISARLDAILLSQKELIGYYQDLATKVEELIRVWK